MGLIRLLLAISVVVAHSSPIFGLNFVGGQIAVQSFYIISGFYMALVLTEKYNKPDSYKLFISNRFLKLFPTYWFILLLTFIIGIFGKLFANDSASFEAFFTNFSMLSPASLIYLAFVNLFIFGQDIANFLGLNTSTGNFVLTPSFRSYIPESWNFLLLPQSWSIAIELTFYLIAPFIVRQKTKVLLIIMGLSYALRMFIYFKLGWNHDPWTYRFFPTEIFFFLLGVLSFRFYGFLKDKKVPLGSLMFVLAILAISVIFYQYFPGNTKKKIIFYTLIPLLIPFIFKLTNKSKLDQQVGELSYPIYMIHFLCINILTHFFKVGHQYLGLLSTTISILSSLLIFKFLLVPFNKYRQSRIQSSA